MMFTEEENQLLRVVLKNAMAEVDAAVDPDATMQPDDPMSLMDHYDMARRIIAKLEFDPQTAEPRQSDVLVHRGETIDRRFFRGPFKVIHKGDDLVVLCDGGGEIQSPNPCVFVEPDRH
jgi:hypothetical protein